MFQARVVDAVCLPEPRVPVSTCAAPGPEHRKAQDFLENSLGHGPVVHQSANALHFGSPQSTAGRLRRAVAGLMLGLIFALHAASSFPALHEFWHADDAHADDAHSECHESDCVVLAFASGSIDPGPVPGSVARPNAPVGSAVVSVLGVGSIGFDHAEPPGRGPPIL